MRDLAPGGHDEDIVRRMSGRWICSNPTCGTPYHTTFKPPRVPGVCDDCGTLLVQRADDKVETVRERLVVYHRDTVELIPYYRARGLLREVDGEGEIEEVYERLVGVLKG